MKVDSHGRVTWISDDESAVGAHRQPHGSMLGASPRTGESLERRKATKPHDEGKL